MSWLFSRVLVEEYLGGNSSDGEPSAPLSGSLTPQAYCAPDKMTAFSRLSRFGMTYAPLTEDRGKELLMSYLVGFRVKTSQSQEKVTDLTEPDLGCGEKWHGWLAKYDPVTSSWKTPQCSLFGEEQESLATLPSWGMTANGLLWEQPTLEPITRETGFGFWPTPTVCGNYNRKGASATSGDGLATAVANWPIPTKRDYKSGTGTQDRPGHSPPLSNVVGGTLNPTWVEWLMGWPLGWTDLKPLEMDKSHCAQQKPGDC